MKNLATLTLGVFLCGCGSMQVTVAVLNPQQVEKEIDRRALREDLPIVLGQSPDEATQPIIDLEHKHFDYLASLQEAYQKKAARQGDAKRYAAEIESLNESIEAFKPRYLEARDLMKEVQAKVGALHKQLEDADEVTRPQLEAKIGHYLRIRQERLTSLRNAVEEETREWANAVPKDIRERGAVEKAQEDLSDKVKSLIQGQGLVEDPYAFAVAVADDQLWAGNFNRVFGRGTFGNFNMAIKMDSLGDFTLKGLTFDPSDVARVASKVTTQALLLASQMAGVPISTAVNQTGTAPVPGAALAGSSKRLTDAQVARAEAEAKLESHQDGLLAVAGTVLREWASLEADNQRAAGIAAIKSGFAANQSRLKMETTTGTGSGTGTGTGTGTGNGSGTGTGNGDGNGDDDGNDQDDPGGGN